MSIIIHGIDMPKEYGKAVGIYPNGVCLVFTEKEATMGKPIWAEELPPVDVVERQKGERHGESDGERVWFCPFCGKYLPKLW